MLKKKKKKFRFKEEDFKVEQSLPSYLIFPMQTEMSCQKAFTRDLKHKKQEKKPHGQSGICPGKSERFMCIAAYVETSPSSLFKLPPSASQHNRTSHS